MSDALASVCCYALGIDDPGRFCFCAVRFYLFSRSTISREYLFLISICISFRNSFFRIVFISLILFVF